MYSKVSYKMRLVYEICYDNHSPSADFLSFCWKELHFNPFLPDTASMLHYPFLLDITFMCSSLFTNCPCFDSLFGQIGLAHDETKVPG